MLTAGYMYKYPEFDYFYKTVIFLSSKMIDKTKLQNGIQV